MATSPAAPPLRADAAARPGPLAGVEAAVLGHLDRDHPEVLDLLRSRIPAGDLGPRDVVRPQRVDRFGFRLRIERPTGTCGCPFPGR